jgi:molecular chaperone DnaK (HSP70)
MRVGNIMSDDAPVATEAPSAAKCAPESPVVLPPRSKQPAAKGGASSSPPDGGPPLASIVMTLAMILPFLAAGLAASGFRGRDELLGMDIGTTYSAVAVRRGANGGNVTIVKGEGGTSVPSVLAVGSAGEWLIGRTAETLIKNAPMRGVVDGKRVIGRFADDDMVLAEGPRHAGRLLTHPFARRSHMSGRAIESAKSEAACKLNTSDCEPDVAFAVSLDGLTTYARSVASRHACADKDALIDSRAPPSGWRDAAALARLPGGPFFLLLTPQAITCAIASDLKARAAASIGHKSAKKVMAAAPADFSGAQRAATMEGIARAGLAVVRLLHEPTAAALAYGLHRAKNVHTVLVFDMGGGTLDVSVLFAAEGSFTVAGTAGDNQLGGEDVDDCVADALRSASGAETEMAAAARGCNANRLSAEAERVKIALSGDGGEGAASAVAWSCGALRGIFSAQEFDTQCTSTLDRAMVPVRTALSRASLSIDEIDEIVLVGGSSRLPLIRSRLSAEFGGRALRSSVDPDLAVALGAAASGD